MIYANLITKDFRQSFYLPAHLGGPLTGAIVNPSGATDLPLGW